MTEQELLDFVVTKLREQGGPSMSDSGVCLYRGPKNRKCAAGWLIPDEVYHVGLEGATADSDRLRDAKVFPEVSMRLLVSLQLAHDWARWAVHMTDEKWLAGFESEARKTAAIYGLVYPEAKV